MKRIAELNIPSKPLVSILIFNYNYGKYLQECFDSVINQTYENIEICFSDNASEDDSWQIALEYAKKYPGIFNLACNRQNFGAYANFQNCMTNSRGKYFMQLCSDDALAPEFIEKCVNALESNHTAAFAMTNRSIMDKKGIVTNEPPFYNESCLIPGIEQAAVYMMAAVNPSVSQIMYNKKMWSGINTDRLLASRWYAERIHDFALMCEFDMVYIKDSLLYHRLHNENDSLSAASNLMEIIGPYVLQQQFAETASYQDNMQETIKRLPKSLTKLSELCLRYCIRGLINNNEKEATRYYHLSVAIDPDIIQNQNFKMLQNYWSCNTVCRKEILLELSKKANFETRSVSYDPPKGSVSIETNMVI